METVNDIAAVVNNYSWALNIIGLIVAIFLAVKSVMIPFTGDGGLMGKLGRIAATVVIDFLVDTIMIVANLLNVYHIATNSTDPSMGLWWAIGWLCLWVFVMMPARAGLSLFGIGD